ncbi:MAG: phage baseplate assembly protein V, partial [Bacteroidota bacterium]
LPGTTLGLKGVGDRFSGKAYISGIIHDIRKGEWITTAQLGLSTEWYAAQAKAKPTAAGLLAGTQGLQIGKVKQLAGDPDSEYRILVTLPLIDKEEGVWARLASFYATNEAGACFYPEIDDEVVVGFLNDDPRYPIILGSVYSSSKAATNTLDDNNHIKSFVTREKMKISFDEEKKKVLIQTPANNELVLSDDDQMLSLKDQNGNSIKLSANGIEINSIADIQINTDTGNVSLSGMEINANAETELSLSGSASASLTASAEVTINGAMVMIN